MPDERPHAADGLPIDAEAEKLGGPESRAAGSEAEGRELVRVPLLVGL